MPDVFVAPATSALLATAQTKKRKVQPDTEGGTTVAVASATAKKTTANTSPFLFNLSLGFAAAATQRLHVGAVACGTAHCLLLVTPPGHSLFPLLPMSSTSSLPPSSLFSSDCVQVFTFGLNNYGQLGVGDLQAPCGNTVTPRRVRIAAAIANSNASGGMSNATAHENAESDGVTAALVRAGHHHSVVVCRRRSDDAIVVLSFGRDADGLLGRDCDAARPHWLPGIVRFPGAGGDDGDCSRRLDGDDELRRLDGIGIFIFFLLFY